MKVSEWDILVGGLVSCRFNFRLVVHVFVVLLQNCRSDELYGWGPHSVLLRGMAK